MSDGIKCPKCGSSNVTMTKYTSPKEAMTEGAKSAAAGAALATAIPIPIISSGLGGLVGGIAGIVAGGQDCYKCDDCGEEFTSF